MCSLNNILVKSILWSGLLSYLTPTMLKFQYILQDGCLFQSECEVYNSVAENSGVKGEPTGVDISESEQHMQCFFT